MGEILKIKKFNFQICNIIAENLFHDFETFLIIVLIYIPRMHLIQLLLIGVLITRLRTPGKTMGTHTSKATNSDLKQTTLATKLLTGELQSPNDVSSSQRLTPATLYDYNANDNVADVVICLITFGSYRLQGNDPTVGNRKSFEFSGKMIFLKVNKVV